RCFRRCAGFLAAGRTTRLRAQLFGSGVKQDDGFGQRDCFRSFVAGNGRVDAVVADIGAVATILDHYRAAFVGVFAQDFPGIGAEATAFLRIGFLFGNQRDRAIEADAQDLVAVLQVGVGLAVFDVSPEPSNAGEDRFAVIGRQADFARQRQQAERLFEVDVFGRNAFRNTGAFRFLDLLLLFALLRLRRLYLLAELQIGPEAAAAQRHRKSALRIFAEHLLALDAVCTR